MTPEIKKILFTTDLSPQSRKAFNFAAGLASRYGANVTILHVMEDLTSTSSAYVRSFLGEDRWKSLQEQHEQEARQALIGKQREGTLIKDALSEFCTEAQADAPECVFSFDDIVVAHGRPVDEIIEEARKRGSDMIVMGYTVHGRIEEAILGSTVRRVLRRSRVPVTLVPLEEK